MLSASGGDRAKAILSHNKLLLTKQALAFSPSSFLFSDSSHAFTLFIIYQQITIFKHIELLIVHCISITLITSSNHWTSCTCGMKNNSWTASLAIDMTQLDGPLVQLTKYLFFIRAQKSYILRLPHRNLIPVSKSNVLMYHLTRQANYSHSAYQTQDTQQYEIAKGYSELSVYDKRGF